MDGQVNSALEAEVTLRVHGPTGTSLDITAVIDTGFTGFLVLSEPTVLGLNLNHLTSATGVLADGTLSHYETYEAEVDWFGQVRWIEVIATGVEPLIGMALLDGHELRIDVRDGGAVEIKSPPTP